MDPLAATPPRAFNLLRAIECARLSADAYRHPAAIEGPACHATLTSDGAGTALYATFRGTADAHDAFADADIRRRQIATGRGSVHHGFWTGWQAILPGFMAALQRLDTGPGRPPIYITGHSLGGAHAVICALHLALLPEYADRVHCYTFGQPRVGDARFAANAAHLLPRYYRIRHDFDLVTQLPGPLAGYHHTGTLAYLAPDAHAIAFDPPWWQLVIQDGLDLWRAYRTRQFLFALQEHSMSGYRLALQAIGAQAALANANANAAPAA